MWQSSADLIRAKERSGASISVYGKMLVFVTIIILQLVSSHDHAEMMHVNVLLVTATAVLAVAAGLLARCTGLTAVGYLSLAIDVAIIVAIPFIWYGPAVAAVLPRTYLLKTALPLIVFSLLVVNTLALKPTYPLLLSLASGSYLTWLYWYAARDPRAVFTDNASESILGPPLHPALYFSSVIVIVVCGVILSYIARSARQAIVRAAHDEVRNSQLSRYFSPNVAGVIMREDSGLTRLGGKKQDVAVMFGDIRDFTELCERYPTEDIITLLSEYHRIVTAAVFDHHGTLDKFTGDGFLATFGTPQPSSGDAENAVRAALRMRRELALFNQSRSDRGLFTIRHGLGVHYGPVIAGNIGSPERLEYTVIGDTVNMASRIEAACKAMNEDILVSEAVAGRLKDQFALKPCPPASMKGKADKQKLYGLG